MLHIFAMTFKYFLGVFDVASVLAVSDICCKGVVKVDLVVHMLQWDPPIVATCYSYWVTFGRCRPAAGIVIRTKPNIEPTRSSVRWFTGPTVKNRLNRQFDSFGPDELNRP
jgi:hypothetical protein